VDQRKLRVTAVDGQSIGFPHVYAAAFISPFTRIACTAGIGVQTNDTIPDLPARDPASRSDDLARKFVPLYDGGLKEGMPTLALHDVALCNSTRRDPDDDMAECRFGCRDIGEAKMVRRARFFEEDGFHLRLVIGGSGSYREIVGGNAAVSTLG
jgi:hypothetical protein